MVRIPDSYSVCSGIGPRSHDRLSCQGFRVLYLSLWGTRWRIWLRHCATRRKIAGSIPDGVIGNFHWHNSSVRTMALGSTQSLTKMSTRNIYWGKGGRSVLVGPCHHGMARPQVADRGTASDKEGSCE